MATQSTTCKFRIARWRWIMVLAGFLSWISLGCNPATLNFLVMPWVDNNLPPEYKLFAEGKEVTLVILSNFAQSQVNPDIVPAEMELAEKLTTAFRERCAANSHKLKVIPFAEARSYQMKQWVESNPNPVEVGKKFKADFVLDMNIQSFSLYEKKAVTPLFRGEAEVALSLYKVDVKDGDHKVFTKVYRGEGAPTPFDAGNTSASTFRAAFLSKAAKEISKTFISYPPDERVPFDHSSGIFNTR